MEWILETYIGDPHRFWDCHTSKDTTGLNWMGVKKDEIREGCQTRKILRAGNRFIKLLSCKHMLPFTKEGGPRVEPGPRGWSPEPWRIIPGPWNLMKFAEVDFKIAWVWWLVFSFHFLPIVMGNVCNCYSVPEPPLYLEAENLFSSFTSPQMERNFALKWVISRVSPTPNVDDINDEMSELWADKT